MIHVPVALCRALLAVLKPFAPTHYAMGRLLVFMYTHDLPTPEVGRTFLSDYLLQQLPPSSAPATDVTAVPVTAYRGS